MSKNKSEDSDDFKTNPFNGERARWEEFHQHLRFAITKQGDLPEEWLEFLLNDYAVSEADLKTIIFPPEFTTRIILSPLGLNASIAEPSKGTIRTTRKFKKLKLFMKKYSAHLLAPTLRTLSMTNII
jgi:hypothetical protein